jgi:hypothetical protein
MIHIIMTRSISMVWCNGNGKLKLKLIYDIRIACAEYCMLPHRLVCIYIYDIREHINHATRNSGLGTLCYVWLCVVCRVSCAVCNVRSVAVCGIIIQRRMFNVESCLLGCFVWSVFSRCPRAHAAYAANMTPICRLPCVSYHISSWYLHVYNDDMHLPICSDTTDAREREGWGLPDRKLCVVMGKCRYEMKASRPWP